MAQKQSQISTFVMLQHSETNIAATVVQAFSYLVDVQNVSLLLHMWPVVCKSYGQICGVFHLYLNISTVLAPVINDTTWKYLQTAQNEALRIATGCHKMSHTDHLHVETKLLSVKYHLELLAKQYWLSCYQSHHPCHHLTTLPAPARNMKGTQMLTYTATAYVLSTAKQS